MKGKIRRERNGDGLARIQKKEVYRGFRT